MKCDKVQEMFPDDWAGTLAPGDRAQFESHIAGCESCRLERESLNELWASLDEMPAEKPSSFSRERFYSMLAGYRNGMERDQPSPASLDRLRKWINPFRGLRPVLQVASCMLLVASGFLSGYFIRPLGNGHDEIVTLRNEVHEMRQMVTISLLQQQSATERLRGVSWSTQVTSPDPEFLSTLIHTVNYDSNVDVRLAAVDALARFARSPEVRRNLIHSLPRQKSPLVQISLIDLLVELHERQSIDVLKQLVDDATQNEQVRKRARWGLQNLS